MENADPGLQLLNPKLKAKDEFHLFPQFPLDIRCTIWEQALCRERLIFITLVPLGGSLDYPWNPWVHGPFPDDYAVFLSQRPIISKLFHVNRESRSCASRFYRVKLSCAYRHGDRVEENVTLYFNPEVDILAISGFQYFVEFAHDIWVHDPRHVGLLNMAMDFQSSHLLDIEQRNYRKNWRMNRKKGHEKYQAQLREALSRLRQVWFTFMQEGSAELRRVRFRGTNDTIPRFKPLFYRPIMPAIPIFDRRPDPRPIQVELRQVFIGSLDPRRGIHHWLSLVAASGAQQDIEYRFMVTYGADREHISNRDDAVRYIQEEKKQWKERLRRPRNKICQPEWLSTAIDETCQDVNRIPQPVMGFWLFPIECLGPLPPLSEDPEIHYEGTWIHDRVTTKGHRPGRYLTKVNMSDYWPELCLSYLP
ncbi:hypothetical protein CDV36_002046 [Fusarium kuroshium]|uniref:2EXR domain-containing protein n=2 Tax=Fusarium solani species complex TaxID=232080 RepID=A0A3M2SMC1_9HYPO|nr:hypothetical protein CDV36_002046 [Fusarium kuroshium]RSL91591.1 hypothetical protein CEP51_000202 [Fusarium floridanum]